MASTPIGQPIPVGELSHIEKPSDRDVEMNAAAIDALRSDIVPAEGLATLAEDVQTLSAEPTQHNGWLDMMQMSWKLAFMPAMAWSTYMTTTWKAWENAQQPQWPSR